MLFVKPFMMLPKDLVQMKSTYFTDIVNTWIVSPICAESSSGCSSSVPLKCESFTNFSTLKRALLHALGSQTPTERCYVAKRYHELYEKQLIDVIKSECGNKPFGLTLQYLSVPPDVAECHMIHDACDGYVHLCTIEILFLYFSIREPN